MNIKRSTFFQVMIVVVVMTGLLIAAWPGVAQNERPPISRDKLLEQMKEHIWSGDFPVAPGTDLNLRHRTEQPQRPLSTVPDWNYLVYQSYRDGNWEIYLAHDGQEFRLTNNTASDARPRLNLDATKVAFNSNRDGNYEIYTMNIDGSNVQRLTFNTASDSAPAWSPDGTRIAFMSNRDGNYEIYLMNADGLGQTRFTYSPSTSDVTPTWSPDGRQIAWVNAQGTYGLICVMNTDGSGYHPVGGSQPYLADVQWSPDGNRFAFDLIADPNYNPFSRIYWVNMDGSGFGGIYWGDWLVDYWVGSWIPKPLSIAYTRVEYVIQNNQVYIGSAYIESNDPTAWTSAPSRYTSSGFDMNPDWLLADRYAPVSQVTPLPPWTQGNTLTVTWSGSDIGPSGISSYDVQYRENIDGPLGIWTNFQGYTTQTSASFAGQFGHIFGYTYCFRSRARDDAGNLEDYPGGNSDLAGGCGDTQTTFYHSVVSGYIMDNRERPVAASYIQPSAPAINKGVSQREGRFDLYFAASGVYTLSASQANFGTLPALANYSISGTVVAPTLYLPPLDNQLSDSHFESGDLSAWNPSGASVDLTPTITSTAHTGNFSVLLDGRVPTDTVTIGPWHSTIEQTINVSPTIVSGTLSLLYRVDAVEPLSDTLNAYVIGANYTLTFTLPVTASEWTHAWFDVSAWSEPTATVKIDLSIADIGREARIIFDEITWGSAIEGSHTIFLPIARR